MDGVDTNNSSKGSYSARGDNIQEKKAAPNNVASTSSYKATIVIWDVDPAKKASKEDQEDRGGVISQTEDQLLK